MLAKTNIADVVNTDLVLSETDVAAVVNRNVVLAKTECLTEEGAIGTCLADTR